MPDLARRLAVARGDELADVVIEGGKVFSAFTREWLETEVAICDGYVAGLGEYAGKEVIHAAGKYVVPGFVDAHMHLESSKLLVDEFARSLREELDYRQEARNASTFHRNFVGHPHVRVPRVYWSYTGARVLTLEFLDGTKIADLQPGELSDDECRRLAYAMAEAWMTMVFRHGIFHGDPHPANILMLGHPERIGLVDFG